MTLVGLLIGLLISVLCMLGSLTLYKNLIQVATESKLDSNHDGQLASAMLTVQLEVQSAGFGIDNASLNHIVINEPETGKRQLLWRFSTDSGSTYQCRGLHEEEDTNGGVFRVLKLVKVDSGCDGVTALDSLTWQTANPIAVLGRWRILDGDGLDNYIDTYSNMFGYGLTQEPCNPYGALSDATEDRVVLTVTAPGSAFLQGAADMTANEYKYCLPNIYPASP